MKWLWIEKMGPYNRVGKVGRHLPAMRFGGSNGRHLKGYLLCKQSSNLCIANL